MSQSFDLTRAQKAWFNHVFKAWYFKNANISVLKKTFLHYIAILLIWVLRIWKDFWWTNKKSKSSLSFRTNNLQHNKKRNLPQFNKSKHKNDGLEFLKQSVLWERQLLSTINQRQNETKLNTYARWRVPEWQLETT